MRFYGYRFSRPVFRHFRVEYSIRHCQERILLSKVQLLLFFLLPIIPQWLLCLLGRYQWYVSVLYGNIPRNNSRPLELNLWLYITKSWWPLGTRDRIIPAACLDRILAAWQQIYRSTSRLLVKFRIIERILAIPPSDQPKWREYYLWYPHTFSYVASAP